MRLLDAANSAPPKGNTIAGGVSLDETQSHFTWRYLNSATRVERILLDAPAAFGSVPDELLQTLSGGNITVLDLACGCGASVLAFVTLIVELRKTRSIPSLPLTLWIFGADISQAALDIYSDLLNNIKADVGSQGILMHHRTRVCDILEISEVVGLCDAWFNTQTSYDEHFVVIGNVSELATSKITQMQPGVRHVLERLSNKPGSMIWIEPVNSTGSTIIRKFRNSITHLLSIFKTSPDLPATECGYRWRCPIRMNIVDSHVRLIDYVNTPRA